MVMVVAMARVAKGKGRARAAMAWVAKGKAMAWAARAME